MLKGDIVSLERHGQQLLYKVENIDKENDKKGREG